MSSRIPLRFPYKPVKSVRVCVNHLARKSLSYIATGARVAIYLRASDTGNLTYVHPRENSRDVCRWVDRGVLTTYHQYPPPFGGGNSPLQRRGDKVMEYASYQKGAPCRTSDFFCWGPLLLDKVFPPTLESPYALCGMTPYVHCLNKVHARKSHGNKVRGRKGQEKSNLGLILSRRIEDP